MFTVGAHIPLRDRAPARLAARRCARGGHRAACSRPLGGLAAASFAGTGDAALYAVILGSGLGRRRAADARARRASTGAAGADGDRRRSRSPTSSRSSRSPSCSSPAASRTPRSAAGSSPPAPSPSISSPTGSTDGLGRTACASARSKRRWALDLRLSLLVLFTLSWIAQKSGTSVLVAGFGDRPARRRARRHRSGCSRRSAASPTGSSCRSSSSSSAHDWSSAR